MVIDEGVIMALYNRKNDNDKKDKMVKVMLTKHELYMLEYRAKQYGKTKSAYIRDLINLDCFFIDK